MNIRILFPLVGALLLAACNPAAQLGEAEQQIKQFQTRYNDGDVTALYRTAGKTFRDATTREELEGVVTLFSARLGKIESTERSGFNTGFNNGATTTTVVMQTRFEQGVGSETYTFQGAGEDMDLVGWTINSDRLMLSPEDIGRLTADDEQRPPAKVLPAS